MAEKRTVRYTFNGRFHEAYIEPNRTLLEVLRDELRLTGAKEGCGTGDCGACTMSVDGRIVTSCLMLAPQVNGRQVTTIEGLQSNGSLDPMQQAFIDTGGLQCGYCIPGMIVAAHNLIDDNPSPTLDQIREGLAGNLCRCTGYTKIYEAVELAAERIRGGA